MQTISIHDTLVQLCGINKSPLNVRGEAQIELKIGHKCCSVDVIIADITADLVLGNPFIKEHAVLVNLKDKIMTLPAEPPVNVDINAVKTGGTTTSSESENTTASFNLCTVYCAEESKIPPFHAAFVQVSASSSLNSMIIYPEDSLNVVGQVVNFDCETSTATMFLVNNTDSEVQIEKGSQIGHAEPVVANQLRLELTPMSEEAAKFTVNSSYNLQMSSADRELRWQELCNILKVDNWKLSPEERQIALCKIKEYEFAFALENEPLGMMYDYEHEIKVGDSKPIRLRPRPLSEEKQRALDVMIDDLLQRGIIRPSRSPWSSPLCMTKKSDNTWRLCIDYRKLNACTIKDAFPLPNINHMLGTIKHSKFYSTMDLASGFHQLRIKETDIPLTAFCTPTNLYEFICLPFGLCNGPPSFVRAISSVLKIDKSKTVIYFDDILVLGETFNAHLQHLLEVLQILVDSNLKLKAKKCVLFALSIEFLGHIINEQGISCSPSKIECIRNIPIPTNPKSLRSYLGFFSYYRKFCPKYSEVGKPLFKLAVADKKDFDWTPEANSAFLKLKEMLCNPPILTLPKDDDTFILTTDASGIAIGSVLTVDRTEGRKVIAYASHLLEKSRQSYSTTKREMYSVVYYVQYFKMYLLPKKFIIETDHRCLQFITSFKDPPAIVARWIAILSDYNYDIIHKPNTNGIIKVADALSRPTSDNTNTPFATSPEDNLLDIQGNDKTVDFKNNAESKTDLLTTASVENRSSHHNNDDDNKTNEHNNKSDNDDNISDDGNYADKYGNKTDNSDDDRSDDNDDDEDSETGNSDNNDNDDNDDVDDNNDNGDNNVIKGDNYNDNNNYNNDNINDNNNNYNDDNNAINGNNDNNDNMDDNNDNIDNIDNNNTNVNNNNNVEDNEDNNNNSDQEDNPHHPTNTSDNTSLLMKQELTINNPLSDRQIIVVNDFKAQIIQAQNSDKNIKRIKELLNKASPVPFSEIASDTPVVKFYWAQKRRLVVKDDILYLSPKISNKSQNYRILVPKSKVNYIMKLSHDDKTAGHRGADKMLHLIKQHYYWVQMRSEIELYVKRCTSCGAHKKPRSNRPRAPLFVTRVSSKFERISIDFAGPFNRTQRGNRYILLGVCCFTKFAFCISMSSLDSQHVARMLLERWIVYFGMPLEIHSDAGSNLIGDLVQQLCRLLNIKQSNSLPYVPQQNGAAEKLVSTIKNMLCHFAVSKPNQWDNILPLVVLAYNNQLHSTTKFTPQQMVMGEAARVSLDLAWGAPPIVEDLEEADYISWLRETLYDIHDYALHTMNKTIQLTKDRFDKGQFGQPYIKDDLVWRLRGKFEMGSRKFQRRYDGVYIVLERCSNTSYLIKHLKNHTEEIVHFNRLKRAYLNPLTLQSLLQQMEKDEDQHEFQSDEEHDERGQPIIIARRDAQHPQIQPPAPIGPPQPDLPADLNNLHDMQVDEQPRAQPPPVPRRRPIAIRARVRHVPIRTYHLRSRTMRT